MRVLLVEDSERLRRSLAAALKKSGYAVDAVGDGKEGLWLAECNEYDVIVLDIMLPALDGFELCRRVRSTGALKKTRVLILSARGHDAEIEKGLQLGADAYMRKPFGTREFLGTVSQLLAR